MSKVYAISSNRDGGATASQILMGKIAWVNGIKVTGTGKNSTTVRKHNSSYL